MPTVVAEESAQPAGPDRKALFVNAALGIFVTLVGIGLHWLFLRHAGALWRDEVVSFNVASQPSIIKLWQTYWYDSFPPFFHLLLRAWLALGLDVPEHGVRTFGLLIGLGVMAGFWLNALLLRFRVPVVAFSLVALVPVTIRTTDTIRAYGLGTLFIVLAIGLVWKVVESASLARFLTAAAAAVLSVQTLYQNSAFVFALCFAGVVVTLRRHAWKELAATISVGLAAAASLSLHLPALRQLREVAPMMAVGVSFRRLALVLFQTVRDGGDFMVVLWILVGLFAVFFAFQRLFRFQNGQRGVGDDLILFAFVALVSATLGFFIWLKALGLPTQAWYFVPLLAFCAVLLDVIVYHALRGTRWQVARVAFLALSLIVTWRAGGSLNSRQTNLDLVARELNSRAAAGDIIIVQPWYLGATFERYYRGNTPWMTIPPLEDQKLHRLDLFAEQMRSADPNARVRQSIETALQGGHRVWLVGGLPFLPRDTTPPQVAPVPGNEVARDHDRYSLIWAYQIAYFVQTHARQVERVPIESAGPVNRFEDIGVLVVSGWTTP